MRIRFWGVRGSIPTPGAGTVIYGGNTACVSVEIEDTVLIFDAGSGIRECGNELARRGANLRGAIFISHTHWDHIQGFPFFVPAYVPGNAFMIYGPPSEVHKLSLKKIMELQTSHEYFPVSIKQLRADIAYVDCKDSKIQTERFQVETCRLNHPVMSLAYKLTYGGKTFIYGGDHEPYRNVYRNGADSGEMDEDVLAALDDDAAEQNARIVAFCKGADLVAWDAQYSREEYENRKGWGHSWYEVDIELAAEAGLNHVVLTHHDPMSTDEVLAEREETYRDMASQRGIELVFAREGMEFTL